MSAIDTVLAALRSPHQEREGQWMAYCPAHADGQKAGRRSLAVAAASDGKVALRCFAGCETAAIVSSAGLRMTDLFPAAGTPRGRARRPPGLSPSHVHVYTDVEARPLYAKERYEWRDGNGSRHKDFQLRRAQAVDSPPPRDGQWVWRSADGQAWLCGRGAMDGVDPVLYHLPDVVRQVAEAGRVYVVEGERKVHDLTALAHGSDRPLVATSHHGAAGAKWTPGQIDTLRGARVVILPDHDVPGAQYAARLAPQLAGVGCELRVVELPGLAEKQDVSDWIAARRARGLPAEAIREELERIVSEAPVWTPAPRKPPPDDFGEELQRDSDVYLARHLAARLTVDGQPAVYDHGEIHTWDPATGLWTPRLDPEMRRRVGDYDGLDARDRSGRPVVVSLSTSRVSGILRQLRAEVERPGFFDGRPRGLPCRDGFVSLAPDGAVRHDPIRPEHVALWRLPFDVPSQPWQDLAPRWGRYLGEVLQRDPTMAVTAAMLAEFVGACLFGLAPQYERCLVLYGTGANGKSVFLNVLQALFPPATIGALGPNQFGRTFLLASLVGKQINIVHEAPAVDLTDSETFKRVVSGQPVTVEHKNRDPFTVELRCGHLFSANKLPQPRDTSPGQFRRWLIAVFDRRFAESEMDRGLSQHLRERELAGIAAWGIEGAQRLVREGTYTISDRSAETAAEWREDSDPVLRWTQTECAPIAGPDGWTPARTLFTAYIEWAQKGKYRDMTETTFGARLKAIGYEQSRTYGPDGKRARCYPLSLVTFRPAHVGQLREVASF